MLKQIILDRVCADVFNVKGIMMTMMIQDIKDLGVLVLFSSSKDMTTSIAEKLWHDVPAPVLHSETRKLTKKETFQLFGRTTLSMLAGFGGGGDAESLKRGIDLVVGDMKWVEEQQTGLVVFGNYHRASHFALSYFVGTYLEQGLSNRNRKVRPGKNFHIALAEEGELLLKSLFSDDVWKKVWNKS